MQIIFKTIGTCRWTAHFSCTILMGTGYRRGTTTRTTGTGRKTEIELQVCLLFCVCWACCAACSCCCCCCLICLICQRCWQAPGPKERATKATHRPQLLPCWLTTQKQLAVQTQVRTRTRTQPVPVATSKPQRGMWQQVAVALASKRICIKIHWMCEAEMAAAGAGPGPGAGPGRNCRRVRGIVPKGLSIMRKHLSPWSDRAISLAL